MYQGSIRTGARSSSSTRTRARSRPHREWWRRSTARRSRGWTCTLTRSTGTRARPSRHITASRRTRCW